MGAIKSSLIPAFVDKAGAHFTRMGPKEQFDITIARDGSVVVDEIEFNDETGAYFDLEQIAGDKAKLLAAECMGEDYYENAKMFF